MSRPVVSYDDITLPYESSEQPPQPPSQPPPQKKRKRNHQQKNVKHWDDPTLPASADDEEIDDDDEGRELTHEEIWDDSALINAWNAAMEEYEVFHGSDKGWKKETVHRSPLWYNVPQKNSSKKSKTVVETRTAEPDEEANSHPLDFNSYVPTHDPTLHNHQDENTSPAEEETPEQHDYTLPLPHLSNVTQNSAFERALQATYWSGYWTACHAQNQPSSQPAGQEAEETEEEDTEGESFVSTQR